MFFLRNVSQRMHGEMLAAVSIRDIEGLSLILRKYRLARIVFVAFPFCLFFLEGRNPPFLCVTLSMIHYVTDTEKNLSNNLHTQHVQVYREENTIFMLKRK